MKKATFSAIIIISFLFMAGIACAGEALLTWNPTTGATGYKVYFGTVSHQYTQTIDVGNVTSYTVSDLTDGATYYFAITAYDSTIESSLSNEVSQVIRTNVTLSAPSTIGSNVITYISDTFQGSGTSTPLQNHVGDTGAGWAILYGSNQAYIDGTNSAVYSRSDANYYNTYSLPVTDYSVMATVHMNQPASGTNCYVSGRTNPSSNARYVAGHTNGLGWGIYYMDGMGHETLLAPHYGQSILSANTTYTLELRIVGSSISMYVNNVLAASVSNTALSSGNHTGLEISGTGFGSNGSYEAYDWKVTSPSAR